MWTSTPTDLRIFYAFSLFSAGASPCPTGDRRVFVVARVGARGLHFRFFAGRCRHRPLPIAKTAHRTGQCFGLMWASTPTDYAIAKRRGRCPHRPVIYFLSSRNLFFIFGKIFQCILTALHYNLIK